jgi:trehalose 6-phosphate phosphatase
MAVVPTPCLSDLRRCAILLDIDGTILDFAPAPRQVSVPAGLPQTLTRICSVTGGALALVSGRSIDDIDLIFSPLRLAAIGVHGAEMRTGGNAPVQTRAVPLSETLKSRLAKVAELGPGILVEDKGYSVALHYRLAPASEPDVLSAIRTICAGVPQEAVEILSGKFVVDIKPAAINKGDAVLALMQYAPFAGRHPIFIGDDLTDLSVFDVVPKFGGRAYSVGGITADVDGHFETPEVVRSWLARIAAESLGAAG